MDETEIKLERARRAFCKGKEMQHAIEYRGRNVFVGIFVFSVGALLLLNTLGIIAWKFWSEVWIFWPSLILLFGLRIIFGRSRMWDYVIFLIGAAIFMLVLVYGLIRIGSPLVRDLPINLVNLVNGIDAETLK